MIIWTEYILFIDNLIIVECTFPNFLIQFHFIKHGFDKFTIEIAFYSKYWGILIFHYLAEEEFVFLKNTDWFTSSMDRLWLNWREILHLPVIFLKSCDLLRGKVSPIRIRICLFSSSILPRLFYCLGICVVYIGKPSSCFFISLLKGILFASLSNKSAILLLSASCIAHQEHLLVYQIQLPLGKESVSQISNLFFMQEWVLHSIEERTIVLPSTVLWWWAYFSKSYHQIPLFRLSSPYFPEFYQR